MAECKERNCKNECYKTEKRCILHCKKEDYSHDFNRGDFLQRFFDEFIKYIINSYSIKKIILIYNEEYKDGITSEDYELVGKVVKEYLNNTNNLFDKLFEKTIVFDNIYFPEHDGRDDFDYSIVFNKLKKIHFNYCKFHVTYLKLDNIEVFFQDCEFMDNYSISNSEILSNQSNVIYQMCLFHDDVSISKMDDKSNLINHTLFSDCDFQKNLETYNMEFKKGIFNNTQYNKYLDMNILKIYNCIINYDFILQKMNFKILDLSESKFKNKVKIQFGKNEEANFYNTNFDDLADFYENEFIDTNFERAKFDKIVVFAKSKFEEEVNFQYTTFGGNVIFKMSEFSKGIDLEDSVIHGNMNFLKSVIPDVGSRETARIIKHSFDDINNIIEANKYYALEMLQREKELEKEKKKNWFEWLVFKIHGISSNHSQDWLLVLFWIINFGFIASLFDYLTKTDICGNLITFSISYFIGSIVVILGIIGIRNIVKDIFRKTASFFMMVSLYILYTFTSEDFGLTDFANVINPFSIMTKGETLNLGMLIFKVIIAYLIYQFIVSVRQNTRRK